MGVMERRSREALGRDIDRLHDITKIAVEDINKLRREVSENRKESEGRDRGLATGIEAAVASSVAAITTHTAVFRRGFFGRLKWLLTGR